MKSIYQETVNLSYQKFEKIQTCCICGRSNCQEAFDHEKVTLKDLVLAINQRRSGQQQIQKLKNLINKFYKDLKNYIFQSLEKDHYEILTYVNKFYFPKQFCQKNKIDVGLISQIMQNNIEKLPSKKIGKLMKKVQTIPKVQNSAEINTLNQNMKTMISPQRIKIIIESLNKNLPSTHFKQELPEMYLKQKKTSISDLINPQQENNIQKQRNYQWRNVRVTNNSRIASLSNKNISDLQVMQQVPILANYRNLKQFQIRNNKISCLSCSIIANNMPFLLTIDIRGNRINDKGITKLIKGIPKLKSFFISQTFATDQSGQEIVKKLHDLEILWSEHTKISNQTALKIASKPKLKVLSLVGNPIDDQYKEKMKKIYISKGYISI